MLHAPRQQSYEIFSTPRAVDLLLTGHTHDLFINYDGRSAMVESSYDAHYVTAIDVAIAVQRAGRPPRDELVAAVPRHRHRDGDARSGGRGGGGALRAGARQGARRALGTTAVELDSRTATVRTREAAIGNLFADAMRASTARRRRGDERRRHPRRQDLRAGRDDHPARHPGRAAVRQPRGHDRHHRRRAAGARWRTGSRSCPTSSGRFPQVSGLAIEADLTRARRAAASCRSRSAARRSTSARPIGSRPTISWRAAATATRRSATPRPLLPPDDSPLLANEVMAYLRQLGTVRTGVEGRIVVR